MTAQSRPSRIGFIRPAQVERAFIVLLYLALFTLVALSVAGTFYGRQSQAAPITTPLQIVSDMWAAPADAALALAIQGVLTIIQYGARQLARRVRAWWIVYLVALGVSVYYNMQAYWAPLIALVPWYVALPAILAGDVVPEIAAVQQS